MTRGPTPVRGPSGRASLPPPWLSAAKLPIDVIPSGTALHRIHRSERDPIFFGPGPGDPPTFRFDSATGAFGVLYAAVSPFGSLVETLFRNPARRMVAYIDIAERSLSDLRCDRDLRLVRLHSDGLQQVGADNALSTGPYEPCGQWADTLWAHRDAPDGIAYASRHDPSEICLAVFERPSFTFTAVTTTPLDGRLSLVGSALDRYGKSISGAPSLLTGT